MIASGEALSGAGMTLVALGDGVAFWQALEGTLVQLVRKDLAPSSGEGNEPQAPLDLGAPVGASRAVCDLEPAKTQLSDAMGIGWKPLVGALTGDFADGGRQTIVFDVAVSVETTPHLLLEKMTPQIYPFVCGVPHIIFSVPSVAAAGEQMEAAGMRWVATFPPDVAAFYEGLGGILFEPIDDAGWTAGTGDVN